MNIKTGRYKSTGPVTAGSASHFRIGDAAYLPDSDAGTDLAGCYRAGGRPAAARREKTVSRTVSMKTALIVIAVAVFVCGSVTCSKLLKVRDAQNEVNGLVDRIARTRNQNIVLSQQVEGVRDLSRIGYIAVTELGMVASDEGNTVVMYVPQVEAFAGTLEKENAGAGGSESPAEAEEEPLTVAENGWAGR